MSSTYDSVLAISQMLIGELLKSQRIEKLNVDIIREQAQLAVTLTKSENIDLEQLAEDLQIRFDIFIQRAAVLVDDDSWTRWLHGADKTNWKFWLRCEKYLLGMLPEPVVRRIDEDTDRILELLGNPADKSPWDRRGLVVGDVQFGKTSNYAALACKAADAGYKIVVVLAGIHESLRMQTQIRMDDAFLGFRTDQAQQPTGVGLFDPSVKVVAATARSLRGDFNKILANRLSLPIDTGPPVLLVVKKNAQMLRNLHSWLENRVATTEDTNGKRVIHGAPALVIDDESDNASVDTGEQKFDSDGQPDRSHKPTAINNLIRQILSTFDKRSYVGYTATPFANIFIHHEGETTDAEKDLFPKNFVVNLHAPSNYFGPIQAFGLEGDDDAPTAAPLLRLIDMENKDADELTRWVPLKHKQDHEPHIAGEYPFPDSLRRAILSFLVVCAVRKLRGQSTDHNSMLVHVTRYTRIQALIAEQISDALVRIRRRLRFGDDKASDSVKQQILEIWDADFKPTTERMRELGFVDAGHLPEWSLVESILPDVAARIRIKQINGLAQDVLDYDNYRETGTDVIVIGGDKLSRGLTLYGLSISYFTRQSDMYDTLLQMGRWFGYRTGYLDLCRLYITSHLNEAFEHIALASDELRREFDYMESIGSRPIEFGLKVKAHPLLTPTAPNKRRHARDVVLYFSYAGGISETKSFSLDQSVLDSNLRALGRMIVAMKSNHSPVHPSYARNGKPRSYDKSYLWTDVEWETIENFLQSYSTEQTALRADSNLWLRYVRKQIEFAGEMKRWNVALIGGDADDPPRKVADLEIKARYRVRDKDVSKGDGYRIKRLVTTIDAGVDMPEDSWSAALKHDPDNRLNGQQRKEPTAYSICRARQDFNINPLLMIYLPYASDIDPSLPPVVGAAIVFPGSNRAVKEKIVYKVNTVYLENMDAYEDELR